MAALLGDIPVSQGSILALLIGSILLYTLYGAIWRIYLSPVAHIPGPLLAKLTFWNEFYYDVVLGGKYTWKILEYHEQYGPVVRINPFEVHIKDSEFYDQVYVGASKRKSNKWFWSMRMFGQYDNSAFDTLDHDKHRMRREPWNPYFSKQSVSRLQPLLIQSVVDKLCDKLAKYQSAGRPICMVHAYACLTVDIISEYAFPEGYNLLDLPDFDSKNYEAWMALSKMGHTLKQFGWLFPMLDAMPRWITKQTSPESYLVINQRDHLVQQTTVIAERKAGSGPADYKELTARPSMIDALLDSNLPQSQKLVPRVAGEAVSAVGAGTLTSSHALKNATYHILANPPILETFMAALETAIPDPASPPSLRELEQMPYLMAIWYETLRNFHGVTHRLQRIFPDQALQYKDTVIPAGTPVSMTGLHVHEDPAIFPSPREFRPERWLPLQTEGQRLQKYICAFGKGSRQCVGQELGKAEVLTTLANVFRRFGRKMRLHETSRERDIDVVYDVFNPLPSDQSNGLMIVIDRD